MSKSPPSLTYENKIISYGQNLEDLKLYGYFKGLDTAGFYIDVGANHPTSDSVTKFFYLRGWNGLNIEPQAHLIDLLNLDRPNDTNLQIGISNKSGKATLRQYGSDGLSTFSKTLQRNYQNSAYEPTKQFEEFEIKLHPLASVIATHCPDKDIHFLKVDVEGLEYEVLVGNDWKKYRPWVICIEATGLNAKWKSVLKQAGYNLHLNDGLNEYYVDSGKPELVENYHAYVVSETIRYDLAEALSKRLRIKNKVKRMLKKVLSLNTSNK